MAAPVSTFFKATIRVADAERRDIAFATPPSEVGRPVRATAFRGRLEPIVFSSLRSVLGEVDLDSLLSQREKINLRLQTVLDQQTGPWGVKVTMVEVKQVDLPEQMIRAIAKQAEAERLRRAKVINAMGEQQAAEKLVEAGRILAQEPQAMQLRYFAALHDIAGERSSTVVFPLPTGLLDHFLPRRDNPQS